MSKKQLVPKYRFNIYKNSPSWKIKTLGSLSIQINKHTNNKKYILLSSTAGVGLVPQVEKFGKEIAGNSYKNYIVIEKNDFAYNKSATKQYPEGYIAMLKDYSSAAIPGSIFTCFRIIDRECLPDFFDYLFSINYHGKWLKKYISVGARAHGALNINTEHLWEIPFVIPNYKEQEKIVQCLKSVDELILLEEDKLEKLKSHKMGLLRKLLPEQDKNFPVLRFPKFKNSKGWINKKLGTLCEIETGKLDANAMVQNGKYHFYTCAKEYYLIDKYAYDTEALLISGNGAHVGYIHYYKGKFNAYQRTYILKNFNKNIFYIKVFLEKNLKQRINTEKNEGNTPYIRLNTLSDMEIIYPVQNEEQKKIAECLSSIDDLISAQTEKIETLTQHKKGLLQGLFPSIEEVENE